MPSPAALYHNLHGKITTGPPDSDNSEIPCHAKAEMALLELHFLHACLRTALRVILSRPDGPEHLLEPLYDEVVS